jgi:acyl carrier protein
MTDAQEFSDALRSYIERDLLAGRAAGIDTDTYLFADGLIDSLKILQLVAFVERATGRPVSEREIVMKHFRSVRAIVSHFWHADGRL